MATIHTFSSTNSKFNVLVYYMRGGIFRCREGGNLKIPPVAIRRVRHSARGHPARGVRHPAVRCGGVVVLSECVLDQSLQALGLGFK